MIRYKRWLIDNYLGSPNALGILADFADQNPNFIRAATRKETIANNIRKADLPPECLDAFEASWEIYMTLAE